jgi:hypothetical protein
LHLDFECNGKDPSFYFLCTDLCYLSRSHLRGEATRIKSAAFEIHFIR